jgi:hypothetical protein
MSAWGTAWLRNWGNSWGVVVVGICAYDNANQYDNVYEYDAAECHVINEASDWLIRYRRRCRR